MRNVDVAAGLANGTRCLILDGLPDAIQVRILSGVPGDRKYGTEHWICKRRMFRCKNRLKIEMVQFPFTLAYAMTIHKAQGQSICKLGVFLPTTVFCHGATLCRVVASYFRSQPESSHHSQIHREQHIHRRRHHF
jgi:hypothetical protein